MSKNLGQKTFTVKMVTAAPKEENESKNSNGGNEGSFFCIYKDGNDNTLVPEDATDTRITYTLSKPLSISRIEIVAKEDNPTITDGHLYIIYNPLDQNREFVSFVPFECLLKVFDIGLDRPFVVEGEGDQLKLRFIFKNHAQGVKSTYYITFSGEEYE